MLRAGLASLLLAGCLGTAGGEDQRQAWLVEALVDDNRIWLARDTAPLQAKYERMADDPYDFMRGTATVFLADLSRPGTDRDGTAFLSETAAAEILLAADPHPENIGTFRVGDPSPGPRFDEVPTLLLEVNDLDGAHYGPYLWDLRRAAVGVAVLLEQGGCDPDCRREVLTAWADAWVNELYGVLNDETTFVPGLVPGRVDPLTQAVLDDVLEGGWDRERLEENTVWTADGRRRFRFDASVDEDGNGLVRPTTEERDQAERLMATYPGPPGFRVLDIARRYGQGIASMPAIRYVIAWDTGDPGPEDDALLTMREVVDPGRIPGITVGAPVVYDSNAHRVEQTHRTLWSRPDADPRLAGLADGAMTFKVLTWSSWNDGYDHEKIARDIRSGALTTADLSAWSDRLGRQLAHLHGRAPTASGEDGLVAMLVDLNGREADFVTERVDHAERDLRRLLADHALFVEALDRWGPLLGADLLD